MELRSKRFIENLESKFTAMAEPSLAEQQAAYMRNLFPFMGIKAPARADILKSLITKENRPPKHDLREVIEVLWNKPEREFQYAAQVLASKYFKELAISDLALFEFMVESKSWWDTVDFIAAHLLGAYFQKFPDQREPAIHRWIESGNIWLQRSTLLFQLRYHQKLDVKLLELAIHRLSGTKEFFLNKAIGWILRTYSKTNPAWVHSFVSQNKLSKLSAFEALRLMKDS